MNKQEIIKRGELLAKKYDIFELKKALNNAVATDDNIERLALQWSLKIKTGENEGYSFTKEVIENQEKKLTIGEYNVYRYFDDMFEAVELKNVTKEEATKKHAELIKKPAHYVSYQVKKASLVN